MSFGTAFIGFGRFHVRPKFDALIKFAIKKKQIFKILHNL